MPGDDLLTQPGDDGLALSCQVAGFRRIFSQVVEPRSGPVVLTQQLPVARTDGSAA